ncbi:hypothetical protein PHAVU_004G073325 [Phaseolus vulgaris]|uniref:protein-S-isoprenylcysteine alpha-carbonyl methylesterase n=1 Tax=Phaseolus vulgaris TaxID=3885 RepID=V7CL91_PHAVU|nr:hypothetical protein PHAVU_002G197000g [Phaseolus vulgaris]ESW30962.1 hypothetical protein PHAVU_002G197000g [Phaseolus vulgaris]
MAALTNRRRTLPPDDVGSQAITADSVSANYLTTHHLANGKTGLRPPLARQESLRRNIEHVAAETYLITRLAFTLLRYLGIGYLWISQLLALGCYAVLLMPGFLQVAYEYFSSTKVRRSLVYGDQPRNRFDLYLPADIGEPKPVLIFVTGGAWIIGYKAWGSLLGLQLAERGIIVACLDYRNFPQGTISDMVNDTSQGISFIINNIANYGGDPNRVYLMGQSAGAHISSCALLEQAARESEKGENVSWSISQIKAYFGLSGGYNLLDLVDHFHKRGLYRRIFLSIMEGEESLKVFSPEIKIQEPCLKSVIPHFPPVYLVHGTADYSIPSVASERFADALQKAGARAELILCEGKTHTDLFLQDPLRGGNDYLFDHAVAIIHSNDSDALTKDVFAPRRKRFVPEILLKLASKISPF